MILVAGGTGFVGGGIVRELCRRGKQVVVLTRNLGRAANRFPGLAVEYRQGDLREAASLASAVTSVEVVVGCQQFPNAPVENPSRGHTYENIDAKGTENLVAAAKAAGVKRYVYISGAGAAADAPYHWFRAKWRAETAVRDSGLTYVIFRPSWIYGPEDNSMNRFLGFARLLPFVPLIGAPDKQRLQPVFIDDVGRAVAEGVDNAAADGQTFDIGGPEVLTMSEIVRTALEVWGKRRFMLSAPKSVARLAAFVLQLVPGRPLTPDAVEFATMDALADPGDVETKLGVKMTQLRVALATYLG